MRLMENKYVRISFDKKTPCLEWIGKKFMPSAEFRASEEESLKFFLEYKPFFPEMEWFVDARNIGALSPEDTQWVSDVILPQMAQAGLTKEAFVVQERHIGKLVVHDYKSVAGQEIRINTFADEEDAKEWLKN